MFPSAIVSAALGVVIALASFPVLAQRNVTATASPAQAEQRVALVIGNAAYKEGPLRNPVNDANDMARTLRELGWKVVLRTNASQRQMKEAIREFGSELTKGSVGLFYFAGHGIQYGGENFLVPIGAQIEREAHVEDESVSANFVLRQMDEAKNRANIVILDACRNNPFARRFRSATRGLAQMDAAQGALVAFATAPGSVAADGEGRNGVYTKHLLQHLRTPGVPVELMFKRVRDGVMRETRELQVPWESSSLRGADFYFRAPDGGTQVPSAAPSTPAPDLGALELALWNSVKDAKSADEIRLYLNRYPDGEFSELARLRIKTFESPVPSTAAADVPSKFAHLMIGKWGLPPCNEQATHGITEYRRLGDVIVGETRENGKITATERITLNSVGQVPSSVPSAERFFFRFEYLPRDGRDSSTSDVEWDIGQTWRQAISIVRVNGTVVVRDGKLLQNGLYMPRVSKCSS